MFAYSYLFAKRQDMREEGFCFEFDDRACRECGGKCCIGESGYIFATLKELEEVAKFLNLDFCEFLAKYVKKVGYKFSFIEKTYNDGFACIFFDENQKCCQIYEVRPKQCRDFPFWKIFLEKEQLQYLKKECPGIRFKEERE